MTNSEWQFEEIEETEIESVARGRKSSVPQELIDGLAGLSKGKAVRLPSHKLDPTADTYRNDKARVAASLRVLHGPKGLPQTHFLAPNFSARLT